MAEAHIGGPAGSAGLKGRLGLLALGLSLVLFTWQATQMLSAFGGLAMDDAYISFRYADHLANGEGLVWNAGERVEGFSNFLWVALLAPVARVFGDLTVPAELLGLLFGAVTLVVALDALKRVLRVPSPAAALLAGGLIASSGYVTGWAVSGLESALHGLFLLWAWARFSLERSGEGPLRPWSAVPLLGLALLRPEGIFVAACAVAFHLWDCRRRAVAPGSMRALGLLLLVLAPLLAFHAFRFGYYGPHLFPNSVSAKVGWTTAQLNRGVQHVATNFLWPYLPLLAAARLLWRGSQAGLPGRLGAALFGGYLAFVTAVGGDWSVGRFYAPLIPLGVVLAVAAAAQWVGPGRSRSAKAALAVAATLYVGVAWYVTVVQRELPFRTRFVGKDAERVAIGRWLRRAAPAGTVVAVFAAGEIPYYSRLRAHDMLGLCDAHIATAEPSRLGTRLAGHERWDVDYTLGTVAPGVLIDPQYIPGMVDDPRVQQGYRREPAFARSLVLVRNDLELAPPTER